MVRSSPYEPHPFKWMVFLLHGTLWWWSDYSFSMVSYWIRQNWLQRGSTCYSGSSFAVFSLLIIRGQSYPQFLGKPKLNDCLLPIFAPKVCTSEVLISRRPFPLKQRHPSICRTVATSSRTPPKPRLPAALIFASSAKTKLSSSNLLARPFV